MPPVFGRTLVALGITLALLGLLSQGAPWLRLGRLPGDLRLGSGNLRVYIPLGTSLLLSIFLTLLLSLWSRLGR